MSLAGPDSLLSVREERDFGSVEAGRMNRTSSAMSETSSRRTPGGMHMSLQARKEKDARKKALRSAGSSAVGLK